MAVAVCLGAPVVRTNLAPAAMALLGNRNWWMPRWLGWLPNVRIERGAIGRSDHDRCAR